MQQLIVLENFHVFVPDGQGGERQQAYAKGQTLHAEDVPEGQSAEDWIAKGLVRAV